MKPTYDITPAEIGVILSTLHKVKDALETLLQGEDDSFDDLTKGVILGIFYGTPKQIQQSLEILNQITTGTEPWEKNDDSNATSG